MAINVKHRHVLRIFVCFELCPPDLDCESATYGQSPNDPHDHVK